MSQSHKEIFERYVYAGPIRHDPDAVAALFTEDGVFEAPLVPAGHALPRRLEGREAIRAGIAAYFRYAADQGTADPAQSAFVLHDTGDPEVFIAEIDAVVSQPDGRAVPMSLVQIFRLRAGQIALLRDYFEAK